uniref:nucleotide sugar dehydrogenase n=1 Tax=Fulvivirga sp. TaxID=1931237 RepID=UPI00404AFC7F
MTDKKLNVAVIGLGYVGLPLAVEAARYFNVLGFDLNEKRIEELKKGHDRTLEVEPELLKSVKNLEFSANAESLANSNFYVVTVPTPITNSKTPDLRPLQSASTTIGKYLKKGDIVVYESTVFPGCTEEECVPILEKISGLTYNVDFYCGYSPERINPGDKVHRLPSIKKVTSGSTPEIAQIVNDFYKTIVVAGTHLASSIKVAEAAKVIENSQRDINIAFVNELALIFDKMNIDTHEVLEAAGTKWNFLPFKPGLVGGHCIGVDPYYLTHKAESLGYHPQVILSGRKINDNMGQYVASSVIKLMANKGLNIAKAKTLVLGITFKENCPDIRNSRVIDIITELKEYGMLVDVYDPHADPHEVEEEYGIQMLKTLNLHDYEAVILAVSHEEFMALDWGKEKKNDRIIYDVKGILPKNIVDRRL